MAEPEKDKPVESPAAPPTLPLATLYVGDLDPAVTESDLVLAFADFGPIFSARVCRDHASGASLRYAYLNFVNFSHAENALKEMNHAPLKGKPMRIMWSLRDQISGKNGVGNLFVKNLDGSVGGSELESLFQAYGTVVSCKVAVDEKGNSKGFGFVQMDTEEAAKSAIEGLNGKILNGGSKELYVVKFVKKSQRQALPDDPKFTNLYIKNLERDFTDDLLREKFTEFGKVCSAVVMKDELGKSRGFGFVSFELPEHAKKAMETMNGSILGSKTIYVGLAQKKAEREGLLKLHFCEMHDQHPKKIQGSNVYVKYLHDSVDDKALREYFLGCGKVVSTKVMQQRNGISRGFGFVCYSSPEEANKAVATLNGTMFHGKQLYMSIAQRREDRRKSLQLHFAKTMAVQHPISCSYPSMHYLQHYGQPRNYVHVPYQGFRYISPVPLNQRQHLAFANDSRVNNAPLLRSPSQYAPFVYSQIHPPVRATYPLKGICPMQPTRSFRSQKGVKMYNSQFNGLKKAFYTNGPSDKELKVLDRALASVDPEKLKPMIGEFLYPRVQKLEPKHATKITGMLLEMNSTELREILQSPKLLAERVKDAVQVLKSAKIESGTDELDTNNMTANCEVLQVAEVA